MFEGIHGPAAVLARETPPTCLITPASKTGGSATPAAGGRLSSCGLARAVDELEVALDWPGAVEWADEADAETCQPSLSSPAHHDLVTTGGWRVTFQPDTGICTWTGLHGQTLRTHPPPI